MWRDAFVQVVEEELGEGLRTPLQDEPMEGTYESPPPVRDSDAEKPLRKN